MRKFFLITTLIFFNYLTSARAVQTYLGVGYRFNDIFWTTTKEDGSELTEYQRSKLKDFFPSISHGVMGYLGLEFYDGEIVSNALELGYSYSKYGSSKSHIETVHTISNTNLNKHSLDLNFTIGLKLWNKLGKNIFEYVNIIKFFLQLGAKFEYSKLAVDLEHMQANGSIYNISREYSKFGIGLNLNSGLDFRIVQGLYMRLMVHFSPLKTTEYPLFYVQNQNLAFVLKEKYDLAFSASFFYRF